MTNKTTWHQCLICGFNFLHKNIEWIEGFGWACFKHAPDIKQEIEEYRNYELRTEGI